jgi:UDP-glucose 4-epimerase
MKVLVTGAGGNLARVVVPALAAAGHTPRCWTSDRSTPPTNCSRLTSAARRPGTRGRRRRRAGACPLSMASIAATGARRTSGQSTWTAPSTCYEAAAAAKVAKVVLASSMAVYGASMQSPPDARGHRHRGQPDPAG